MRILLHDVELISYVFEPIRLSQPIDFLDFIQLSFVVLLIVNKGNGS